MNTTRTNDTTSRAGEHARVMAAHNALSDGFVASGTYVVTAGYDNTLLLWNQATMMPVDHPSVTLAVADPGGPR